MTAISGVELSLHYADPLRDHFHRPNDTLWTRIAVEARLTDGTPVGHLKLNYIEAELFDERFGSCFDWIVNYPHAGHMRLAKLIAVPEAEWDSEHYAKLLAASGTRLGLRATSRQELEEMWENTKKLLSISSHDRFVAFRDAHRGRPLVEAIRVYDEHDTSRIVDGAVVEMDPPERNAYRKRGIGSCLYEAGALWMAERGLQLWASQSQSPAARAAWRRLEREHEIGCVTARTASQETYDRRFLDGAKIQPAKPRLPDLDAASPPSVQAALPTRLGRCVE